ncbi:hypothetical protein AVEN_80619-1 [Araneus ventricosus]|uniref:Uncharacterized protein n=1 Tax=Araneus ventricosus TaxID=182803 RepID=A0A4Y2WW97_ARAVE|nr:hypothetical protein AVEN_80619-1 [Araneus ventricosus]
MKFKLNSVYFPLKRLEDSIKQGDITFAPVRRGPFGPEVKRADVDDGVEEDPAEPILVQEERNRQKGMPQGNFCHLFVCPFL